MWFHVQSTVESTVGLYFILTKKIYFNPIPNYMAFLTVFSEVQVQNAVSKSILFIFIFGINTVNL